MIKKRNPLLAGIMSFLAPGLGHVYAGFPRQGLSLIAIEYGVILICGVLGILSTFYGYLFFIVFLIGFYLFAISRSIGLARQNKEYHLKSYNRWYWYLLGIAIVALMSNLLFFYRGTLLGYQTYRIPAKSMEPTLQAGDFIIVDTRYRQPKIGEIVVFLYPKDKNIAYVKRVAALGNDTLSIENGAVIRNGETENILSVPEYM